MTDIRLQKLADILVNYSAKVKPGDWVVVEGHWLAEPLLNEIIERVLEAGGKPSLLMNSDVILETTLRKSNDEQLKWNSPIDEIIINQADVSIYVEAYSNSRSLNSIDPARQQMKNLASNKLMETFFRRAAEGNLRWVLTQYPCPALAQDAEMSLREFEDFLFKATFADKEDPVSHWQVIHDEQQRLVNWLIGKDQVIVRSPNTDLKLSIKDRTFINSDGKENMPSGEIFTGPLEDSVNGWVKFTYPAILMGHEVEGVRLEFKDGKVVNASAEKNEAFMLSMLDTDEGSRYLGEFAIGTNFGIDRFSKNILFDEKIGGSFHLALGNGYPETGSVNKSAIHWDMICDMRQDGEIMIDGELFYKNGKFQV